MNSNEGTAVDSAPDTPKSVHLSASAGSGKTRALKNRYLSLLDALDSRGLAMDQAVAITFTDKAAAEIKERVLRGMPEPLLKKIVRGRQDLRISTIHSFCMNLLKRYPLEAGLPPDFGVLEASDQAHKIRSAVENALEEADRDAELMAPLAGFTADELVETIECLLGLRSKLNRLEIDAGGPEGLVRAVRAGMGVDRAEAELTELVNDPAWKGTLLRIEHVLGGQEGQDVKRRARLHALLSAAPDPDSASGMVRALFPVYFTKDGKPRERPCIAKKDFTGGRRKEYEEAYFGAQDLLERFMALHAGMRAGRRSISLLRLFQLAEKRYRDAKLREGLLDFDDLEIYAYRLLQGRESADILYWLDRKVLHFLVDEFQDTSDIQWAILNKLTEELFSGAGTDKPMRPTLFVVGDEKQSIYRFREANYRLIETVREKMERNLPPGTREIGTLDKNYRSTPEIVGTVNEVFGALWGNAYQPSGAERGEHGGSVRLIELLPKADADAPGPDEAGLLARELRRTIEARTPVYDASGNRSARPAAYGDCAVLIQSRTRLKEYEAALQREGIPFRVVGGIGFYEEDEVQALIGALFFLWNRDDLLSLATALKSPLFGFSDEDLYALTSDNGNMLDSLRERRPAVWELLREWMNLSGLVPLSDLVHRIVADTGAYVRFGSRTPQAIFNIDKLLDTAREFDRRGYTTLQDFVERIRGLRGAEQREAAADMNLPGFEGAVSVMTVHKAKGLEYPIVFLPGMNQARRSASAGPGVIVSDTGGRVRMAVKGPANPLYEEMWELEKEELWREHQRLLYVAMTRARDHLVMIGTLAKRKTPIRPGSWLSFLHDASPKPLFDSPHDGPEGVRVYSFRAPARNSSGEKDAPPPAPDREIAADREVRVDARAVLANISPLPRSGMPEWKSATDFIEQIAGSEVEALLRAAADKPVSPITRGLVLHRCLESYGTTGTWDVARTAAEFPEILALPDGAQKDFFRNAESILSAVVGSGELAWIFERGPNSYSELPFLYRKGPSLVSGVIDRVVLKEGKGIVIDYKSILIENDAALEAWTGHYRPQVRIYCEAVKEIFRLPRVEGHLLFLDSVRLGPVCSIT
jgi:ATP-dependent helicase/nuclease subunit A